MKSTRLAPFLLLGFLSVSSGASLIGCSGAWQDPPAPETMAVEDPAAVGEEVVDEEDVWAEPELGRGEAAGQLLVVVVYIGAIIGSAVLPFLLFL